MKIWLYTVTYNEAKILPFFLRHYEPFCDRITVFDDRSTDGTQEIVRGCAKAVLEPYPYPNRLDDRDFIQLATDAYKRARGQADWVIWVDPDEFLYHRDIVGALAGMMQDGVQVPTTRGFQMIADRFPDFKSGKQIWELADRGVEDPVYAKACIFRPEVDMHWDPGKHYVHGNFKRGGAPVLKVLHYRCLGMDYLRERHQRNFARCSQANLKSGLGVGVYPDHKGHMSETWFNAILPTARPVLENATFHELVRVIHQGAALHGHDAQASRYTEFQPTWGSEHPWLHETIERVRPQVIIEVGTFLGRSAVHMGHKLQALGLDSAILCVDTWLGDDEHWTIAGVREAMGFEYGRPLLYEKFRCNVRASGMDNTIIPVPLDSISGARLLARLGVKADMVYIDGGHVGGEVFRDLVNYWSLLRPGGVLLADDYADGRFPGLHHDVDAFARERGLRVEVNEHKARIWKP